MLKNELLNVNKNIGFANCIPPQEKWDTYTKTPFGNFVNGSPLSFHLHPIGFDREVHTNIEKNYQDISNSSTASKKNISSPIKFMPEDSELIPDWQQLSQKERNFITSLRISNEESTLLEQETLKQAECPLWVKTRKFKITSSNAHKVFIRVRNFQTLVDVFVAEKQKELPQSVKDAMKHGKIYEPIARDLYSNVMNYHLDRGVDVRET